jgi:hypothetical protein
VNIMSDPDLNEVPGSPAGDAAGNVHDLGRESGAERLRRLRIETHKLAREQIEILTQDLSAIALRATEVADGIDLYPVGVRELCSRLADELRLQGQTLTAIMARTAP